MLELQPNFGCCIVEGRGSLAWVWLSEEWIARERQNEEQSEFFQFGQRPLYSFAATDERPWLLCDIMTLAMSSKPILGGLAAQPELLSAVTLFEDLQIPFNTSE